MAHLEMIFPAAILKNGQAAAQVSGNSKNGLCEVFTRWENDDGLSNKQLRRMI